MQEKAVGGLWLGPGVSRQQDSWQMAPVVGLLMSSVSEVRLG